MGCAPRGSPAFCAESISNRSLAESRSVPVLEGPRPGYVGAPSLPAPPGMDRLSEVSCMWWLWPTVESAAFPEPWLSSQTPSFAQESHPRPSGSTQVSLVSVTPINLGK